MSKAKERALAAYPPEYGDEDFDKTWDSNEQYREPYQEGYEQAEKDLALTWEDVQLLDHFVLELVIEEKEEKDWGDGKEFYTEVLKRFKETKG